VPIDALSTDSFLYKFLVGIHRLLQGCQFLVAGSSFRLHGQDKGLRLVGGGSYGFGATFAKNPQVRRLVLGGYFLVHGVVGQTQGHLDVAVRIQALCLDEALSVALELEHVHLQLSGYLLDIAHSLTHPQINALVDRLKLQQGERDVLARPTAIATVVLLAP